MTRRECEPVCAQRFLMINGRSTSKDPTGVELRFVVRSKMISIARNHDMLYSVITDSDRTGNQRLCADPEGEIYNALLHCALV